MKFKSEMWEKMSVRYPSFDEPSMRRDVEQILSFAKESVTDFANKKILDIGCGTGTIAIPLALQGANVTAVDISEGMLKRLRDDAKRMEIDSKVEAINGDWKKSLKLDSFNVVVASMTPAVSGDDEFNIFIKAPKDFGIFVGWGAYRINVMVEELYSAHKEILPATSGSAKRFANFLEKKSLAYKVRYFETSWEECMEYDKALSYAVEQLERNLVRPNPKIINEVVKTYKNGDKYCFKTEAQKGIVLWRN